MLVRCGREMRVGRRQMKKEEEEEGEREKKKVNKADTAEWYVPLLSAPARRSSVSAAHCCF